MCLNMMASMSIANEEAQKCEKEEKETTTSQTINEEEEEKHSS